MARVTVLGITCLLCFASAGTFESESGGFVFHWTVLDGVINGTFCANGTGMAGIGFGGGMSHTDMIVGWVGTDGKPVVIDAYSTNHSAPLPDTALGGTDDVKVLGGTVQDGRTCLSFARALDTGDQFDRVLAAAGETDLVYAWADGAPGMRFHGQGHNHVRVDLSREDGVPETQFGAEETGGAARQFVAAHAVGTLATLQTEAPGAAGLGPVPYASVADYADESPPTGRPLVLLSALERNVINMQTTPRVSLAVHTPASNDTDPMAAPRVTLIGRLLPVPAAELPAARRAYLAAHPQAAAWIGFGDFVLYRLDVLDVYWVGGFGNDHYIGFVSPAAYLAH